MFLFFSLLYLLLTTVTGQRPCLERKFYGAEENVVCVCNATYCDDVPEIGKLLPFEAAVFTSSKTGKRLTRSTAKFSVEPAEKGSTSIHIDPRTFFQSIIGFGGAFTDSAGINMASLSANTRENLLKSYFGETGIKYTTGRVPMASTDFSTREYSYADEEGDFNLSKFQLAKEDLEYKIPYILAAQKLANDGLQLFASPWSAPGWMKTNGHMRGGGSLKGDRNGPYYQTWANYFVRFFEEYSKNGVNFWGLTVQNEPSSGIDPDYGWQTMYFNASMTRDFIRDHLGPSLKASDVTKNLKVITLDDNRNLLVSWADEICADNNASAYVDGFGVHWYLNAITPASFLSDAYQKHPDKFLLATEACSGFFLVHGPILGDWSRAENYASDIIDDLENFVSGWTDWNLCLDTVGGPNWVANNVDSPIIVNSTADEFYKQPTFYAMGHFSTFLRPGATRIKSSFSPPNRNLKMTAFNLQYQRILVILNKGDTAATVSVEDATISGRQLPITVDAHSIVTVIWNKV